VSGIDREFVRIHEFIDANGRLASVLLDFCLMKAGFPPALHSETGRPVLLWHSEDDAVLHLAQSYLSAP
jgi:hypothetical protein